MTAPKASNATEIAAPTRDHVNRREEDGAHGRLRMAWLESHMATSPRREDRLDDRAVFSDAAKEPRASRELGNEERL